MSYRTQFSKNKLSSTHGSRPRYPEWEHVHTRYKLNSHVIKIIFLSVNIEYLTMMLFGELCFSNLLYQRAHIVVTNALVLLFRPRHRVRHSEHGHAQKVFHL